MAGQKPKTARSVAMTALNRFEKGPKRSYISTILDELLQQTTERQRATDLVFGTIRNRSAIDMVITRTADCPVDRIPTKPLNIIRIGAYELIYCPAAAEYSIVNEAVENAKAVCSSKQPAFVNALLRQLIRHIQNRQSPLTETKITEMLPQTPSSGCEFDTDILPDPADSPADYLSSAFSIPNWLTADWLAEFGFEKTRDICFANNRRPSVYLRANILKTTPQQLAEILRSKDIQFEMSAEDSLIKLKAAATVNKLPGFAEGLFSVQDPAAARPVRVLRPRSEWKILDLCAAPGTKTTQLAELTGDKAMILATDIITQRLQKIAENTARLGITSVRTVKYENLQKTADELGPFDAVLLDVPCSNTAVLAKRAEVRLRITPKTIQNLTKIQSRLLETAAVMIKPQGKICYSTCSIQPAENGMLIRQFLQKNRSFKLQFEELTLPSAQEFDHDGGYVALIVVK